MEILCHPDLKIAEIISGYPETSRVFVSHGLEALVSEDGLRALGSVLTLNTTLRTRSLNVDNFVRLLLEALETANLLGRTDFPVLC
jgi:hypothetical protein